MRRIIPAFLLVAVLAIGGGLLVNAAYDAGVHTAVTTAVGNGAQVAPVVVPPYGYGNGYGYGWHPFGCGFSIFGLLFGLFFLFIIFGLIRAIFWGGAAAGARRLGRTRPPRPRLGRHGPSATRGSSGSDRASRNGTARPTARRPAPGSSNEPPAANQGSTPA